jgi:hypothetical protein
VSVVSAWLEGMNHPVLTAIAEMHAAFDEIVAVDPMYMAVADKEAAMVGAAKLRARADALEMRLLVAGAVDVAEETGARSTAAWLADEARETPGAVRAKAALAASLETSWIQTEGALMDGTVNLAQTRAISDALEALPQDLGDALLAKAETYLLEKAATLGPRELRHLGHGLLQCAAPDIADEHEFRMLEAEEAAASSATKLTFRPRGDGSTDVHARVADHVANRLRAYTDAYANPRRPDRTGVDSDFMRLPQARRRGQAFCWLLEGILDTHLPQHGGTGTSIVVTAGLDTLVTGVGVATTSTGDRMTAEQVRRLARQAGIIPAVLGTKGEILDLGRKSRLFKPWQRRAMDLRDKECTTRGCHVPAAYCHAHHWRQPWSQGGKTDVRDGKLLCPFHHGRAHDPKWDNHHHPDGSTTFTRRQ